MLKKKTIPSAGVSMMDLISNALAGVIILFFILSKTKFPSIPPERVCGTLVIEFIFLKKDSNASSSVYVNYMFPDNRKIESWYDLMGGKYLFDNDITKLDSLISTVPAARCSYDSVWAGNDIGASIKDSVRIPAVRTYRVIDGDSIRQIVILHEPVEGIWKIGLLYTDHKLLLNEQQPEAVKINLVWYDDSYPYTRTNTIFLTAPTASCYAYMRFKRAAKGERSLAPFSVNKDTLLINQEP